MGSLTRFLVANARAASKPRPRKPLRTLTRPVTLFERTWKAFPLGLLPIRLLTSLSKSLSATVAFQRDYDQPYHHLAGQESAPIWESAPALLYDVEWVASFSDYELRQVVLAELERLLRFLRPRKTEVDRQGQFAILGTLRRLGQLYAVCKKRWKAPRAQAVFLEEAGRLWQAAQQVQQMLEDTGFATRGREAGEQKRVATRWQRSVPRRLAIKIARKL